MSEVVGLLYAGGQGRRLGGIDKAQIELNGKPLWDRALLQLRKQASFLIVTGPEEPDWVSSVNDVTFAPDPLINNDSIGPAGGLLSGLEFAERLIGPETLLITSPIDVPYFPDTTFDRLIAATSREHPVSTVIIRDRIQPVFAAWHVSVLSKLRDLVHSGERSMGSLIHAFDKTLVEFETTDDAFYNINTKDDLDYARKRAPDWFGEGKTIL